MPTELENKNPYHRPSDTAESRLKDTVCVVEATSMESLTLWSRHAKQSPEKIDRNPQDWQQISPGWIVTVGEVNGMPCNIDMQWNEINGKLVCFFFVCSQIVDHRLIDKWLAEHFVGKRCNAMNFHLCLHVIKEAVDEAV